MSTEKQTTANRKNAQSSTGPKTPQGKAVASQNAVKHGFFAKNDVISGEDPAAYEEHRQDIYDEYAPLTPTESVLTQRIASLSWRLMRADRLQTTTINTLVTEYHAEPMFSIPRMLRYMATTESPPAPALCDAELILGSIIHKDFQGPRSLERLAMYERRIENSLFKTIRQIQQIQQTRIKADAARDKRDMQYLRREHVGWGSPHREPNHQNTQNKPNSQLTSISEITYNKNTRATTKRNEPDQPQDPTQRDHPDRSDNK